MADRPVTRRYVARVVQRATQEVVHAIVTSEMLARLDAGPEPPSDERVARVLDWTYSEAVHTPRGRTD